VPLPPCVPTFHGSDPGMPSSTFRAHMARLSARWLDQTNPARSPHMVIMSKDATTASIPSQSQAQAIHLDMKQSIHLEKLTVELTERSTWLFSHLPFPFRRFVAHLRRLSTRCFGSVSEGKRLQEGRNRRTERKAWEEERDGTRLAGRFHA